jgi:phasin family protein
MSKKSTQNLDNQTAEQARDFARQKIAEVQDAQENILEAITKAQQAMIEASALKANEGVVELNKKALDFTKSNISESFELATRLVDVTDMSELVELQKEFVTKQLDTYTNQAKELTNLAGKTIKS